MFPNVLSTTNHNSPRQEITQMPIKSKMDIYYGIYMKRILCARIRTHKPQLTEHNQESFQAETTLRMSRICGSLYAEHKIVQTNIGRGYVYMLESFLKEKGKNSKLKMWNLESVPSESFASSTREENANININ